jgi:hypothetical protein
MLNRIRDPTWSESDAQVYDWTGNLIHRCCTLEGATAVNVALVEDLELQQQSALKRIEIVV